MESFKCYHCPTTFGVYGNLIQHLVEEHPSDVLKYREFELDSATGKLGYRTKEFSNITPKDGEVFVTSDNRVGIFKSEERSKKSKLNTPVKSDLSTSEGEVSQDEKSTTDLSFSALFHEMEMEPFNDSISSEEEAQLLECIPSVLQNLKENGHLESYKKWCNLVAQNEFPMKNIGFLLFLDIIDWFSTNNTSEMRFIRPETKYFWQVGYRLFKGKFLRFMSGPKNTGQIIEGIEEKGFHEPVHSKINFAVPSIQTMSKEKITPIYPGVLQESISMFAQCLQSKFVKICIDGKKIARGKGNRMGDIDCWGFESKPSLKDKMERYDNEKAIVDSLIKQIDKLLERDNNYIPEYSEADISASLLSIVQLIGYRIKDLREMIVRIVLGIDKFTKLGDQSAKHWSRSKYAPVISSLKVSKYDTDQAISSSLQLVNELCSISSELKGQGHCYSSDSVVDITKHEKYHQMKNDIPGEDPKTTKQKSEFWYKIRKKAKVTGSTCNAAVGLGKLKEQQSHFDRFISGAATNGFSEQQLSNMRHGEIHEIDGIATVVARVLPFLCPDLDFFEEGARKIESTYDPHFMLVSPDGCLRKPDCVAPVMMYENKCKIDTKYSATVYYSIPKYYIPQLLCEMYSARCVKLLFTCWSKASTTVFTVDFDESLWTTIWTELNNIYGGNSPKRPNKFSENRKQLMEMINTFQLKNVHFVGEFPSCSVAHVPEDVVYDGGSTHTWNSNSQTNVKGVECEKLQRSLRTLSKLLQDIYKICRTSASEILVFMANDLNRSYHAEINNAHPIAYALKGTSMTNEIFAKLVNYVIQKCEEHGLGVIATSSDGQWHRYGVRDSDDKPLTVYQLQRDVWRKHSSRSKQEILRFLRSLCRVCSLDDIVLVKDSKGRLIASHAHDVPLKVYSNSNLTWEISGDTKRHENNQEACNSSFNELVTTVESCVSNIPDNFDCLEDVQRAPSVGAIYQRSYIDNCPTGFLSDLFDNSETLSVTCFDDGNGLYKHSLEGTFLPIELGDGENETEKDEHKQISIFQDEGNDNLYSVMNSAYSLLYGVTDVNIQEDSRETRSLDTYIHIDTGSRETDSDKSTTNQAPNVEDEKSVNCSIVLSKLRNDINPRCEIWKNTILNDFEMIILDKTKACQKLQKGEMIMGIEELNHEKQLGVMFYKSWNKSRLHESLKNAIVSNDHVSDKQSKRIRRKNPDKLKQILSKWLNKVPKETLAIIIAQNDWMKSYNNWWSHSAKPSNEIILDSKHSSWFSVPSENKTIRFHFPDCCHILTCLRSKICTTGISGLKKSAWEEAAMSEKTQLNVAIVNECVDKQSVAFARRIFDEDVEIFMRETGYDKEANFVFLIRQWFEAEDSPGIPVKERCSRRKQLREYLLNEIDFSYFPPYSQYIKGIPIVTFESLLVHVERKLQIFQYLPKRQYNVRSLGTQEVEQFFSTIRDLDPSGQGTPKPDDIPDIMATAAYLDNVRMNPDRPFFMKTTTAPVYPDNVMMGKPGTEDHSDIRDLAVDHFFDTTTRKRLKQKRKSGLISSPSQPAHRQKGVRQYHSCDESKLLPHLRKGILDI